METAKVDLRKLQLLNDRIVLANSGLLVTAAPPRDREEVAAVAKARSAKRFRRAGA